MLDEFRCQHIVNDKYIYQETKIELERSYIIGNSHYQFSYIDNGFTLFNAESVGQNTKYINEIIFLMPLQIKILYR
jgi:hypothetical protein